MQAKSDISTRISSQVNEAYNALKNKVDDDLTKTLGDMQANLASIKENFADSQAEQKQKALRYEAIIKHTKEIGERSRDIREQLQIK